MRSAKGAFTCLISSIFCSGQKTFTVLSPHVSNIYAKKRCIAKKLILTTRAILIGQRIDMIAGDFCRQIHLTRHFSHAVCKIHFMHITLHGSTFHLHAIHDERLIVRSLSVSSCLSFSCFCLFTSCLPCPTCTLTCTPSMSTAPKETPAAPSPNEEYCPPGDVPSSHRLRAQRP